jgi:hypothetical protein
MLFIEYAGFRAEMIESANQQTDHTFAPEVG